MDERLRFVREHRRQAVSMSELCRAYGISRRTGYKWLARFEELGEPGLSDRSRAPERHPNATAADLEDVIVEFRRSHMRWGPRKLRAWLRERIPNRVWPSASTFGEILQRHGLVLPVSVRRRSPPFSQPLAHAEAPNEVWCADFKGWFRTRDGARCDPLTMTDAYSRYLLCARGVERTDGDHVKPVMERAFSEFGLPVAIRTDNGSPFASVGLGGLSRLSVWLVRLGIRHERIAPGKPQENGRHERMHRTMKAETASPPAADLRHQQRVFDRFRQADASTTREHGGLGIGMAIAKQLVELHGGVIRAESRGLGQGARFSVTVTNAFGSATSNEATLTVGAPPSANSCEFDGFNPWDTRKVGSSVLALGP